MKKKSKFNKENRISNKLNSETYNLDQQKYPKKLKPQEKKVCAQLFDQEKGFKICYIHVKRKPK